MTPPPAADPDTADLSLVDALAQMSFVIQGALAEATTGHDLSIIQTRLLGVLRDREPTHGRIGRTAGPRQIQHHRPGRPRRKRGLVRRAPSSRDRRSVHVSITDAGRELGEEISAKFDDAIAVITARLTEPERTQLRILATRLVRTSDAG